MSRKLAVLAAVLCCEFTWAGAGVAACDPNKIAEIPVTMKRLRPMVTARINGVEAQMLFDTGAAGTMMFPGAAAKFSLTPKLEGQHFSGRSNGRDFGLSLTEAANFSFAGVGYHQVELPIPEADFGAGVDGLLGQNHLRDADMEIDLAHGIVRLFAPRGCETSNLAYWSADKAVSVVDIEGPTSAGWPRTFGTAKLNGVPIRLLFDTGTTRSHATLEAAFRAGVDPRSGVQAARGTTGIGGGAPMTNWLARFAQFQLGDEVIPDASFLVVEKPNANADMIIGADFFVGHRVLISKSQHRLYFSANPDNRFGAAPRPSSTTTPPPPGPPT